MQCPRCNRTQIGRIANAQYYCWNCYLEFHQVSGGWEFYELAEDGALVPASLLAVDPSVLGDSTPLPAVAASSGVP